MGRRVRALIVDDEPLARERLRDLLGADPEIEVVGVCADGVEAAAAIRELAPEIVFLDVQMPEQDGFDVLDEVGVGRISALVFVTAYDEYALRAFEAQALDYLLKPFDEARFRAALARAKERARAAPAEAPRPLTRLMVRSGGRFVFVRAEEIDWVGAEGNYVSLHVGVAAHLLRETIGGLEAKLDPDRFLRIHRSTIVNLDRVREIAPLAHGEHLVVLEDGTRLTLSRGYRDRLARFGRG